MNETMQKAMDKLRDEMARECKHDGVQQVGAYMTDRLLREPGIAAKVLAKGKTIKGAFEAIHSYASKHRTGSYAFVSPETAFELVAKYFGIKAEQSDAQPSRPQALADLPVETPKAAESLDDELDLDKLLEL